MRPRQGCCLLLWDVRKTLQHFLCRILYAELNYTVEQNFPEKFPHISSILGKHFQISLAISACPDPKLKSQKFFRPASSVVKGHSRITITGLIPLPPPPYKKFFRALGGSGEGGSRVLHNSMYT
jgi:hypothetical protein